MLQQHRGPSSSAISLDPDVARPGEGIRPHGGSIQDRSDGAPQCDLASFRGMAMGIGLSLPVWVLIGVVTWWVMR